MTLLTASGPFVKIQTSPGEALGGAVVGVLFLAMLLAIADGSPASVYDTWPPHYERDGLDQNRAFIGLGAKLAPGASTEVGYLNQYVNRRGRPDALNHIASITLLLSF